MIDDSEAMLFRMAHEAECCIGEAKDYIAGLGLCLVRDFTRKERLEEAAKSVNKAIACAGDLLAEINRLAKKEGAQ